MATNNQQARQADNSAVGVCMQEIKWNAILASHLKMWDLRLTAIYIRFCVQETGSNNIEWVFQIHLRISSELWNNWLTDQSGTGTSCRMHIRYMSHSMPSVSIWWRHHDSAMTGLLIRCFPTISFCFILLLYDKLIWFPSPVADY